MEGKWGQSPTPARPYSQMTTYGGEKNIFSLVESISLYQLHFSASPVPRNSLPIKLNYVFGLFIYLFVFVCLLGYLCSFFFVFVFTLQERKNMNWEQIFTSSWEIETNVLKMYYIKFSKVVQRKRGKVQ